MRQTTLVIMAAGIGSRFGKGVKQLTSFGPSGEIIMDYSVYDAIEAGFDRVVFVIRRSMLEDFRERIGDRIGRHIPVSYVFQELEDLPEGFTVPEGRTKPWGTGQAILACRGVVHEPFAVINADDYYGKDAFRKVHDYLVKAQWGESGKFHFCMAGFILENTLSAHGGVTRGICRVDSRNVLSEIRETPNVVRTEQGAAVLQPDGTLEQLDPGMLVSMNFWGFTPDFIDELAVGFRRFLSGDGGKGPTGEYLLPIIVDGLLREDRVDLTVLQSEDRWFGVTYQEDVPYVRQSFAELTAAGVYPAGNLWKENI